MVKFLGSFSFLDERLEETYAITPPILLSMIRNNEFKGPSFAYSPCSKMAGHSDKLEANSNEESIKSSGASFSKEQSVQTQSRSG